MSPEGFCCWNKEQNLFHIRERLFKITKNQNQTTHRRNKVVCDGFFFLTTGVSWRQIMLRDFQENTSDLSAFLLCVWFFGNPRIGWGYYFWIYTNLLYLELISSSPTTNYWLSVYLYTFYLLKNQLRLSWLSRY